MGLIAQDRGADPGDCRRRVYAVVALGIGAAIRHLSS